MTVPFTQYIPPNGHREQVEIDRPEEIEAIACRFIASGGRYECEILTTRQVSFTAAKKIRGEWQDIAIAVGKNEQGEIMQLVDQVIRQSEQYIEAA